MPTDEQAPQKNYVQLQSIKRDIVELLLASGTVTTNANREALIASSDTDRELAKRVTVDGRPNVFAREFVEQAFAVSNTQEGEQKAIVAALKYLRRQTGNQQKVDDLINLILNVVKSLIERAPYKGLNTYTVDDGDLFRGRDKEVEKLKARALLWRRNSEATRFLVVVGGSGHGKSSLVRAGLQPWLQEQGARTLTLKPGDDPINQLSIDLKKMFGLASPICKLEELLCDSTDALQNLIALETDEDEEVWFFIDQFEQLFTSDAQLTEGQDAKTYAKMRNAFIGNLVTVAKRRNGVGRVVITLRSDYLAEFISLSGVDSVLDTGLFTVSMLSAENLRQIITEPAAALGYEVEEALIQKIFEESGLSYIEPNEATNPDRNQPVDLDKLPLISHALLETWIVSRGAVLRVADYTATGGFSGAIVKEAEAIFDDLKSRQQEHIAHNIFLRLTAVQKETAKFARRRVTYEELALSTTDEAALKKVLRLLAEKRLISAEGDIINGIQGDTWIEMRHEALIKAWPRFEEWLTDNRPALETHALLREQARLWEEKDHARSYLYRGGQLEEAIALDENPTIQLNSLEQQFAAASKVEKTRIRNRTLLSVIAAILLVPILVFSARWVLNQMAKSTRRTPTVHVEKLGIAFEAYEVTNERFRWCRWANMLGADACGGSQNDGNQQPVTNINVSEAMAYCQWIGRTLPTAEQWLYAAPGANKWPMLGKEAVLQTSLDGLESIYDSDILQPIDAARPPQTCSGDQPLYDLAGNASEWTRTFILSTDFDTGGECVNYNSESVRKTDNVVVLGDDIFMDAETVGAYSFGGNWDQSYAFLSQALDDTRLESIGFRCVTLPEQPVQDEVVEACPQFLPTDRLPSCVATE